MQQLYFRIMQKKPDLKKIQLFIVNILFSDILYIIDLSAKFPEIAHCFPSNLYDFLNVDRVHTTLSRLKSNRNKYDFFMMIHKIGRKHYIWNIEIFRKFSYIFLNQ